ncbi:MAG: L-lysine 6-transaminase [Aeromicrobium sp.]|uniref:L-lysine 6-transaminase n=1 Tax=Aeromicrobium sp. TaxID=1871063 RepID=UPI00260C6031|nr:L-lysine 6-transaminase [Aeromicrobium sp.]MDF1705273.1 L-lysine 6-transaminase [Aeromicrobium sp.]
MTALTDRALRPTPSVPADQVHASLARHLLVDGYDLVVDLDRSHGSYLHDARTGRDYLDLFTYFASNPIGTNHPGLTQDPEFLDRLQRVAVHKPSNSDIYTTHLADFVDTFARVVGHPELPHLFFIDGGALAVENALKVAFDWKSRLNESRGIDPELGTRVLHLEGAFHGRSGYTLSLTNTDPNKVARFPKFDWPRIPAPYTGLDPDGSVRDAAALEAVTLQAARDAFAAHPHDIACFLMEPIQGEGGDRHFRPQFLQAMRDLCHEHDALFVLDEVQTGLGMTGTTWAFEQLGVVPDVVAFGKKAQVCGIMAGGRVDEVPDNCFTVGSRINSTWGGSLTDMVRSAQILRVIERDGLVTRAADLGAHLVARLRDLAARHPLASNPRGAGLMCAIDLPDAATRDRVVSDLMARGVLVLGCGTRSLRFRPSLAVALGDLDAGLDELDAVLGTLS